ncbi:MFS transporter [Devosia nitrariae]|uniref:MFS transporter n=1 Tax=Devosia nitrariae TaxID=2071872 RepID=A0ABQ5W7B8_9HYPH|nr:MFS transporter [Devosia nitrariae]GLQ55658.1 MFS transporter [Devosia nitrariae]
MSADQQGWRMMFAEGRALAVVVFAGGVGLQAIETFIGSTLLPSVVADIGGLELFAWNTTVFIVASIVAAIFAAVRPFGIGPRGSYVLAALSFALGSLICGAAPNMQVMLVGRAVQGFGGGLITAMSYAMIRIVFPEALWGRAFALISSVWGVSTLIGPAIGGVFASLDAWRWAFWLLVPLAALLGVFAFRVIPARSGEAGMSSFPVPQILLLVGAVLAVSLASILTENVPTSALLIVLAVLAIVVLGVLDQRSKSHLLPRGTFAPSSRLAPLLAAMLLVNLAIICDIFVPLFVQNLHGQSPLIAGYMVALVALGWSSGSVVASSWTGARARIVLVLGPTFQAVATVGLALFLGLDNRNGDLLPLLPVGIALILLGAGIGISWPHLSTRLLRAAPEGEGDVTTASISMTQAFAAGLGAAVAGVIVNAAGLASAQTTAALVNASTWLFSLFTLVPLVAIPIVWTIVRGEQLVAVEEPAE